MSVPSAQGLARRLKSIREPTVRRLALAAMLAKGDAAAWVEVLAELLSYAARTDDADAQIAVDCLAHAVAAESLSYDARTGLYVAARAAGHTALARLFLDVSPATASEQELEAGLEPERPVRPRGRALTLGERKTLARNQRRDFLVPLLRDPHPDVVRILVDNPRLTERDVVTIAALRPAVPASLAVVAEHPRWSSRYTIRRALVLNPYTPTHLAVRLATTLRRGDLVEIARSAGLAGPLRAHAAELLAGPRRAGKPG